MRRASGYAVAMALCFLAAALARGQTALTPQISGNTLTATIDLPGGVQADLTISFENAVGLNANALGLTASLVNPTDPSLLARLPNATAISIPAAFPVLLRVDPAAASSLSFSGVYKLSVHTHNLTLVTNSPLRLLRASSGGSFEDLTSSLESGSARVGGAGGGFSEFLVVADLRRIDPVISSKFDALSATLMGNSSAIAPAVFAELQQRLADARNLFSAGSLAEAVNAVSGFGDYAKQQSGANIPDVWQASGGVTNVAGLLRSSADTLKFSLTAKANGTP